MDKLNIILETEPPKNGIKVYSRSIRTGNEWRYLAHLSHDCSIYMNMADHHYWFGPNVTCHEVLVSRTKIFIYIYILNILSKRVKEAFTEVKQLFINIYLILIMLNV